MRCSVIYYSATGNTRKIAQAIASGVGCIAQEVGTYDPKKDVDLLFIGASMYQSDIHPAVRELIEKLSSDNVGCAAVFGTGFNDRSVAIVRQLLDDKRIPLCEKSFSCKGRFLFFQRKHPDEQDLADASAFAKGAFEEAAEDGDGPSIM